MFGLFKSEEMPVFGFTLPSEVVPVFGFSFPQAVCSSVTSLTCVSVVSTSDLLYLFTEVLLPGYIIGNFT